MQNPYQSLMNSLHFTIIRPILHDTVVGPLEICIQLFDFPRDLSHVSIDMYGFQTKGVLDLPYCHFLLPTPTKSILDGTVAFHLSEKTLHLPIHLEFACLAPDYQEAPYEFIGAKKEGFVLKRKHIYSSGPPNLEVHPETYKEILDHSGDVILDVGCGIGAYVRALTNSGKKAFGVEIHPDFVMTARKRAISVARFDGTHLPFKSRIVDTVIAVEVLEHVEAWRKLLMEMLRVCRKNVLISTPNVDILARLLKHHVVPWHILEASHCNFFTPEIWRHIIFNLRDATGYVKSFSSFQVNGELFDMHLFVNITKGP